MLFNCNLRNVLLHLFFPYPWRLFYLIVNSSKPLMPTDVLCVDIFHWRYEGNFLFSFDTYTHPIDFGDRMYVLKSTYNLFSLMCTCSIIVIALPKVGLHGYCRRMLGVLRQTGRYTSYTSPSIKSMKLIMLGDAMFAQNYVYILRPYVCEARTVC